MGGQKNTGGNTDPLYLITIIIYLKYSINKHLYSWDLNGFFYVPTK